MKKAFLILAHQHAAQLERLIRSLDDGQSLFFVHIDKDSDIRPFELLHELFTSRIIFINREKTSWGRFGLVQATLNGLRAIAGCGHIFHQIYLISGQDYPLQSNSALSRFAEENRSKIFIEYFHLPAHDKWKPNGGLYRVNKYFFGFNHWNKFLSRSLNLMASRLKFLERRMYAGMEPYAGSMWWILSHAAMVYILEFVDNNPGYVRFHQHTFAADEVFFHTILLNATAKEISRNIVNENGRFIKWQDHSASHPEMINDSHVEEMNRSKALFARKFEAGSAIPDQIDMHRQARQQQRVIS